jgi:hypothetical protein
MLDQADNNACILQRDYGIKPSPCREHDGDVRCER